MNDVIYVVALFGIAIGVLLRTWLPYLKQLAEGEAAKFETRYLVTAIAAFLLAIMTAYQLIAQFSVQTETPWWVVLILAVLYGTTWNSAVNRYLTK